MDASGIRPADGKRWRERAERFTDAFGTVLALVLLTYVLTSLLGNDGWDAVLIMATTGVTSVFALTSSHSLRRRVRVAIFFSLLSLLLAALGAASGADLWLDLAALVQVALLIAAMLAVLVRVVSTAEVDLRTILGAVSVYTVLGLLFGFAYEALGRIGAEPFFAGVAHPARGDFLFFSYTTLTTTGYGNLVPAGQPGKMFASFEMLLGQIFLITLVARLVGLWRPGEKLRRRRSTVAEEATPAAGGSSPTG